MAVALAKKLRQITKEEAIQSYKDVKDHPATNHSFERAGLDALDYFFLPYRLKARTKRHISFYEAMRDPHYHGHLNELVQRYKKKDPSDLNQEHRVKAQYDVFQLYYGTVNQFRPLVAKWIYRLLKPTTGILDFSAGWGGRAMAAMSMGIPYIGIDANKNLQTPYERMIRLYEPHADIQLYFQPSEQVDFSQFRYDLVFTSPPYFMIEEYEKMPPYSTKEAFLQEFFIPVTMSAWEHLQPGGNMALNMPEEMYEAVRPLLPKVKRTLALPLKNRHPSNAVKRTTLGKTNTHRQELIYVWHKQRR